MPGQVVFVVPTRNRADLAQASVHSVLAEDASIRVLVSDNSTDPAECASLRAACAGLSDDRVRYVRPAASLAITEHWAWALDRALEDPTVTSVGFLTDRMLITRGELQHVLAALDVAPGQIVSYNHELVDDRRVPVRVVPNEWSGRLLQIPSSALIHATVRGERPMALPRMLNSIAPRALFEAIRARFGSVFASVAPDFAFAFRALAIVDAIAFLDRPVLIERASSRSTGRSYARGNFSAEGADFVNLAGAALNANAPAPQLRTLSNSIFNEYCFARAESPGVFPPLVELDYLAASARDIDAIEDPALAERTRVQLRELGWTRAAERRARLRRLASFARFYGRRPRVGARRAMRRAFRQAYGAPRTAASTEEAIADLENRPVPPCDDGALLRPLLENGARIEVLARP